MDGSTSHDCAEIGDTQGHTETEHWTPNLACIQSKMLEFEGVGTKPEKLIFQPLRQTVDGTTLLLAKFQEVVVGSPHCTIQNVRIWLWALPGWYHFCHCPSNLEQGWQNQHKRAMLLLGAGTQGTAPFQGIVPNSPPLSVSISVRLTGPEVFYEQYPHTMYLGQADSAAEDEPDFLMWDS